MDEPAVDEQAAAPSACDVVRASPLFRHLDADALREFEAQFEWFALPGGATLFEEGDAADALYVLRSGSLGAYRRDAAGDESLAGLVAAGELVGEVGLLVGAPRNASVRALRDSELLRLSAAAFEAICRHHPQAMMEAARSALRRAAAARSDGPPVAPAPRTFAVIAHDDVEGARAFAHDLVQAFSAFGDCTLVDAAGGGGHTSSWYTEIEQRARRVVYLADGSADWAALCQRQADCLLLLADSDTKPRPWPAHARLDEAQRLHRPAHLVLRHRSSLRCGAARAWLAHTPAQRHHHVRDAHDVRRIARLLAGRSLSLVLSGGGARGFAHIGAVRALREAGLEIDSVGGTSIGAIIGAGIAREWNDERMHDNFRRYFVDGRPLGDYTLPLVALTRGRRVSRLLRDAFGPCDIEDLALPYFCCSSNLTDGALVTHRSGPLWLWLRASCAIPGILPPVLHGGHVFVDGAVMNNLPTDIMAAGQPGAIAAIDIGADDALHAGVEEFASPPWWRLLSPFARRQRPGILGILLRSGMVNAELASAGRRDLAQLLLTPPVSEVDLLDWHAYERAVEAGYQHALRVIGTRADVLAEQTPLSL